MITPTLPAVGDPTERGWAQAVIDALVDLNSASGGGGGGSSGGSLLLNGSFEIDADADSEPDNWTITTQTNGAFTLCGHSLADTNCVSGSRAIKFTSIGGGSNGGGQAVSDFFEVSPLRPLKIEWLWYCTSSSAANFVKLDFYDAAQAFISPTVTVFQKQSTNPNPTSWAHAFGCAVPPATARYAKLTLIGCDSSVPTACSTYFDGVAVSNLQFLRRADFHGRFVGTAQRSWFYIPYVTGPHRVTCIGGGGAGEGNSTGKGVGGGSGGLAQSVVWLTAGTEYSLWVGYGGEGASNATGGNGVDSVFGASLVVGAGGKGGIKNGLPGAGGAVVDCIGDIIIPGNDGKADTSTRSGSGGDSVLGHGGAPGVNVESAPAADPYGGGQGGCGCYVISTNQAGGDGGGGLIIIEW